MCGGVEFCRCPNPNHFGFWRNFAHHRDESFVEDLKRHHFAGVITRWLHLLAWAEWISKPGVDTRSEFPILNPHTMRAGVDFPPELNIYYYIVPGIHSGSQPFVLGV